MSLAAERDEDALRGGLLSTSPGSAPTRILFVDRTAEASRHLAERMGAVGRHWRVEWAPSGEEALRTLAGDPVDVVIVNEQLAEMDGVTVLTRVRDRHPTAIRMILSEAASSQRPSVAAMVA